MPDATLPSSNSRKSTLLALGAIGLWATLASLSVSLARVPPFLLTGLALLAGSLIALPLSKFDLRQWRVPLPTLALGVYGLFGYHFLFFIALRFAPAVQANLVNYLWPLLIVLLAPVLLREVRFRWLHVLAACVGFSGATIAIMGNRSLDSGFAWGYIPAAGSALIWSSYSLLTQRVPHFPNAAIGSFALVSGLLSLLCHALLEPSTVLSLHDVMLIAAMGLGPLGAAFFLWDAALKAGDARRIGLLSFLTPLLSTLLLLSLRHETPGWHVVAATVLIVGAAAIGLRPH